MQRSTLTFNYAFKKVDIFIATMDFLQKNGFNMDMNKDINSLGVVGVSAKITAKVLKLT